MEKKCLIISGGEQDPCLPEGTFDLVIAVDKGMTYAEYFSITPDVIIGDFDSAESSSDNGTADNTPYLPASEAEERYTGRAGLSEEELEAACDEQKILSGGKEITVIRLRKKKDDPDTLAAVRYALKAGVKDITFCCIMGGRFDHMLSNLQIAAFAAERGATAHLFGTHDEIHVFKNSSIRLQKKEGRSLSAFALSDCCTGVSISGTLYPAENLTLMNSVPLGLSNEWTSDLAEIRVTDGILAVISSEIPGSK